MLKVGSDFCIFVFVFKDSKPLPALTAQQMIAKRAVMRLMYPVSNGAQHRHQGDWVPVTKPAPPGSNISEPVPTVTIPVVPPMSAAAAAVELASARAPACGEGLGAESLVTTFQPVCTSANVNHSINWLLLCNCGKQIVCTIECNSELHSDSGNDDPLDRMIDPARPAPTYFKFRLKCLKINSYCRTT